MQEKAKNDKRKIDKIERTTERPLHEGSSIEGGRNHSFETILCNNPRPLHGLTSGLPDQAVYLHDTRFFGYK